MNVCSEQSAPAVYKKTQSAIAARWNSKAHFLAVYGNWIFLMFFLEYAKHEQFCYYYLLALQQ